MAHDKGGSMAPSVVGMLRRGWSEEFTGSNVPVNMVLNVHRNTETIRLIRDGEKGGGEGVRSHGRGRLYTYRYTVTTRMTCIKMGSDESHFNVSLIVRDKVTRQCPQTTAFEEKGEPKRYRTEVLPLTSLPPYR